MNLWSNSHYLLFYLLFQLPFVWSLCVAFRQDAEGRVLFHSCLRKSSVSSSEISRPIVIIHGLLGSSRNFQSWARMLQKKLDFSHDIVCIDLFSHGRSAANYKANYKGTENILSYEVMAKDIYRTLEYIGTDRCHLVGHSMGGKAAAAMSLLFNKEYNKELPLDISSLCLMDIAPVEYKEDDFSTVIDCIHHLRDISNKWGNYRTKAEIQTLIGETFSDKALALFITSNLIAADKDSLEPWRWSFHLDVIERSMREIMAFPSTLQPCNDLPTLILKGSNSRFVRSFHTPAISQLFPLYTIASVKDAGHWLHFEKPEETTDAVVRFLSSVAQLERRRLLL